MADAIREALTMPLSERKKRQARMKEVVHGQDIAWWRETFLADLDPDLDGTAALPSNAS